MTKGVLPLEELGQALTNSGLGAGLSYEQWKMDKLLGRQMESYFGEFVDTNMSKREKRCRVADYVF